MPWFFYALAPDPRGAYIVSGALHFKLSSNHFKRLYLFDVSQYYQGRKRLKGAYFTRCKAYVLQAYKPGHEIG